MPEIIIKKKVKDPNKELEAMGVPQDLLFGGQNTLLKQDLITRRGKQSRFIYFKLNINDKPFVGCTLKGCPLPKNAVGISAREYFIKTAQGQGREKEVLRMLDVYRDKQRAEFHMELETIRNAKAIEAKILKRD